MESVIEKIWPKMPDDLRYVELRLPGTFRELVFQKNLNDRQIGRIVRCLALDSEFWKTPDIAAQVEYYLKYAKRKRAARDRKRNERKREKLMRSSPEKISSSGIETGVTSGVTVTRNDELVCMTPIPEEKTSSILKEKISPPIYVPPTKEKAPVSLEKRMKVGMEGIEGKDPDAIRAMIQEDLFSAASSCVDGAAVESVRLKSPELGSGGPLLGVEPQEGMDIPPEEENDQEASDEGVDAAWIPSRFVQFWRIYPRKVGKSFAYKTFVKIIKTQKNVERFMATLIASVEWWKEQESWKKDGGKYIPYPATWLNKGHWEDSKTNENVRNEAEFLILDEESTEDLIRRMNGE